MTTKSLEALRQYSLAVSARAMGDVRGIEGPLLAALSLDPDFAMAHLRLGGYYLDLAGNTDLARPSFDKAYALRDRVTDREKHFIAAEYFSARQQFEQARDSLKALTTLYPDDPEFRYELALAHYARRVDPMLSYVRRSRGPACRRAYAPVMLLARNSQPREAPSHPRTRPGSTRRTFSGYGDSRSQARAIWPVPGAISRSCPRRLVTTPMWAVFKPRASRSMRVTCRAPSVT